MAIYTAIRRGDIFTAEVTESYGGYQLTISRMRQEKKPKVCFTNFYNSRFDAMMKMEEYIPELIWKEIE